VIRTATEIIRLFRGATELNYSVATFEKTNDHVVNQGKLVIEAEATVVPATVIDWKQADGTTTIFSARVIEKIEEDMWTLTIASDGYELLNTRIDKTYTGDFSPEAIVEDVIDNFSTNLTYASTSVSGVTITDYVAKAYLIDVIKDMIDILRWQLVINTTGQTFFDPKGITNNGRSFTNGTDINILNWREDSKSMFNQVRVIGDDITLTTNNQRSGTGAQAVFTLDQKPVDNVKVTVDGVEVINTTPGEKYGINKDDQTITFTAGNEPANGTDNIDFDYSYRIPITIEDQDDDSITEVGYAIFKEIKAPWIKTFADARKLARELIEVFSSPLAKAKGEIPGLDFTLNEGEQITLTDPIRNKAATIFVVDKILYDAGNNITIVTAGPRDAILDDWQREVQERIKVLERRFVDTEITGIARVSKHNLQYKLTQTTVWKQASPVDSFTLGHVTLGRLRSINTEADCSDNNNNGVWTGSGIDGSQFTTTGFRLSAGEFNGSDRIITVTNDSTLQITSDISIALAVKVASLPGAETYLFNKLSATDGYAVRINSSNQVELIYRAASSDTVFAATTALTANVFQHVIFTKSGTALVVYVDGVSDNTATGGVSIGSNTNALVVGEQGSNFFTGFLDELRIYDEAINATRALNIKNFFQDFDGCQLYLSMDNPRLGNRETTPAVI